MRSCTLVRLLVKNLVVYHLYPNSDPSVWVQWNDDEGAHDWFIGLFQTALAGTLPYPSMWFLFCGHEKYGDYLKSVKLNVLW